MKDTGIGGYSLSAGLEAINALQKFMEAGLTHDKFVRRLRKVIHELDDRRTLLTQAMHLSQADDNTKQRCMNEIEEIQNTFVELNIVAEAVYDLLKKYPGRMPKPTENAWSIFSTCLWGRAKKESPPFILGIGAGNAFALRYGNLWDRDKNIKEATHGQ